MKEIIDRAEKRLGKISGIIHCDGEVHPGQKNKKEYGIEETSEETIDRSFIPGIKSILVLEQIFKNIPLDFFLVCPEWINFFARFTASVASGAYPSAPIS